MPDKRTPCVLICHFSVAVYTSSHQTTKCPFDRAPGTSMAPGGKNISPFSMLVKIPYNRSRGLPLAYYLLCYCARM